MASGLLGCIKAIDKKWYRH